MSQSNSAPIEALTARELEILAALVDGLTNQEIANTFHLAVKTVKWYNTQIYSKLGVTNRHEAIEHAQRLRLFEQPQASSNTLHNLPEQVTPFIGREAEIQDLINLLMNPDVRLVTIVGPGGIGKTRLSLQTGQHLLGQFSKGVFLVRLAPLSSAQEIPDALVQLFQLQAVGNTPDEMIRSITRYLENKTMLLVLDNFEHLLPNGTAIISRLLEHTAHIKVLVTSRERLNLASETVFTAKGMVFPDQIVSEDAMHYDAVQLFMQHARQVKPDFEPDLEQIIAICKLTDGMPLALVLAAAWVGVLSLAEITGEIRQNIDFLAVEIRDIPLRQRSIQAVFESTWNRLTPDEQHVFTRFSVLRGGCTRQAAQAVAGATPPILMQLINKSLIWRDAANGRYEIHELLRQYAAGKLDESGGKMEAVNAHAAYFVEFVAGQLDNLKRGDPLSIVHVIAADWENVMSTFGSSWVWQLENFDVVRTGIEAMYLFHGISFRDITAIHTHLATSGCEDSHPVRQMLEVRFLNLDHDGLRRTERILEQVRERGDRAELAFCYRRYGIYLSDVLDDREAAVEAYQRAVDLYRELGDIYYLGQTLMMMGWAYSFDLDRQLEVHLEAVTIFEELGNRVKLAHAYVELAHTYAFTFSDIAEGERYGVRGLEIALETGVKLPMLLARVLLGWTAFTWGDFETMRLHAEICLKEGHDVINYEMVRVHPCVQLGIVKSLADNDYEAGLRLNEHARNITTHPSGIVYVLGMSSALLGLGRYAEAASYAKIWLDIGEGARKIGPIALIALAMARTRQYDYAAELLGFVDNYRAMNGWMERWSLVRDVLDELHDHLGMDGYQVAFERGKGLDLDTVLRSLPDEF